jgi:hypothetical protein
MDNQPEQSFQQMKEVRDKYVAERSDLLNLSRELTIEEENRLDALNHTIDHLKSAIESLQPDDGSKAILALRDGRYDAHCTESNLKAELRIDINGSTAISLDVFSADQNPKLYIASFITNPHETIPPTKGQFGISGEDGYQNQTTGTLYIVPASNNKLEFEITLTRDLWDLIAGVRYIFQAEWKSSFQRTVELEVEQEEKVDNLVPVVFQGEQLTPISCFGKAGIKVTEKIIRDNIPQAPEGWEEAYLHWLMSYFSDVDMQKKEWILHLLMLSNPAIPGLLGIMFDTDIWDINGFPRQGAAVFLNEIRRFYGDDNLKPLNGVVHELGHAFNLLHRFERGINRADSTSFMNYAIYYKGGNHENEYWQDFQFTFDEDELRFLRHAPYTQIIPGGAEFATARYWMNGSGGYVPYRREKYLKDLILTLDTPATGNTFGFGTPVYLSATLTYKGENSFRVPECILDPKAGFINMMIKKIVSPTGRSEIKKFRPIVHRDFSMMHMNIIELVNGGAPLVNNINLHFGTAGFTFAEPGRYEVFALIYHYIDGYPYLVQSNPINIIVRYPRTSEEEIEADTLLSKEAGYYFALGGTDRYAKTENKLIEIKQRRKSVEKVRVDPLVAYINRSRAINLSRSFPVIKQKKLDFRSPKMEEALPLLEELRLDERIIFDKATQKQTRELYYRLKGKRAPEPESEIE